MTMARTSAASEPRERSGVGVPASERVGESEGHSPSVENEWKFARAWLHRALGPVDASGGDG